MVPPEWLHMLVHQTHTAYTAEWLGIFSLQHDHIPILAWLNPATNHNIMALHQQVFSLPGSLTRATIGQSSHELKILRATSTPTLVSGFVQRIRVLPSRKCRNRVSPPFTQGSSETLISTT